MNIIIQNNTLSATINTKGAELISLKNENREFIWEGNPAFWGKHSPVLFPIVGTLKNNTYNYSGQEFSFSRHGFARDLVFKVKQQTKNSVVFSLESSEETFKNYPFSFELQLIYILASDNLTIQYKVINKDEKEMPFSIGAHPAFALPKDFNSYSLSFDEDDKLFYFLLENDLLSDKTAELQLNHKRLNLDYKLFEHDALVFKKLNSKAITINEEEQPILKIAFPDFPNLGIWTKTDAPFICIEPWFGYSDTPKNSGLLLEKEGIIILKKNETFESQFSIQTLC